MLRIAFLWGLERYKGNIYRERGLIVVYRSELKAKLEGKATENGL